MIEMVEKIDVNSRISASVPGKEYSRYPSPPSDSGALNELPTPDPMSSQKTSGVPSAPTIRLRCRKNRTISLRPRVDTARKKFMVAPGAGPVDQARRLFYPGFSSQNLCPVLRIKTSSRVG